MSLSKQFKTDADKETNGIRVEYAPNADGTIPTFVISRASRGNKRYLAALERHTKPHRAAIDRKVLPAEVAENVFRQVFIDGVLQTWENVPKSDVSGNPEAEGYAEFNSANANSLFARLPDLYQDLNERSADASNFRDAALEEDGKN